MPCDARKGACVYDQPLTGIRVLELACGVAGPYAGKLFADFGADVIKVEPPEGDESRRSGPYLASGVGPDPDSDVSALYLHLNTNKRSIVLDLDAPDDLHRVRQLIASVDVCIESFPPGRLAELGLDFTVMRGLNDALVLTSITPFGQDGPHAQYHGSELVYSAYGGLNFTRDRLGRPLALGGNLAQYHAGNLAAAMAMGALIHGENGGGGTHLDIAIADTEAASADSSVVYLTAHAYNGRTSTPPPPGETATGLGPYPNGTFDCMDGAVMVSTLPQWVAGMQKTLDDPVLDDLIADTGRLAEPDTALAIRQRVAAWFAGRSRREAMLTAQANRWPVTAIQGPGELTTDPHLQARDTLVRMDHPLAGEVVQVAHPFRMADAWRLRRPAPALGEHTVEVLAEFDEHRPRRTGTTRRTTPPAGLPLAGVRVVDLTVAWSGPFVTMLLADLGAEVIRVENPWIFPTSTRGVFPRPSAAAVAGAANLNMSGYPDLDPGPRPWNRSAIFNWHARNKLSITADLRKQAGREAFLRLIERSDVLVENNSPHTLDSLGLGWPELEQRNPNLIALRMPSCGLTGPYRDFIGFGGSFEGLVGLRSIRGLPGGTPAEAPSSLHMDAAAGATGTFATLVALRARAARGAGCLLELAQMENLAHHIGEIVMAAERGVPQRPTGNRDPRYAPQGVYPCSGTDRWVAISVGSDADWQALVAIMGSPTWALDERFGSAQGRAATHDELDERLSEWTRSQDRFAVFRRCQAEGIACAPVMDELDLYADPQLRHRGFFRELDSPHTGRHEYPGHVMRWTGPALRWERAAPGLGEDNEYVYKTVLGLSDDQYEELREGGHISEDYLDRAGLPL